MCGRFTLTAEPADLQAAFNLAEAPPTPAPRYNIAPTQPVAVVANNFGGKLEFFLWEVRRAPDESLIKSCAIITVAPNTFMEKIHDRMPVILPPAAYGTWLSPGDLPAETALPLLKAFAASKKMKAAQVSTLVNSPAFDSPECVKPV